MDASTLIALIAFAGTTLAAFLTYRSSRAATAVGQQANALQRATAAEVKADAAEEKADDAERRADACMNRLRQMEIDLVKVESKLRYFVTLLHDPYMSIDHLRERIPADFGKQP